MMDLTFWYKGKINMFLADTDVIGHIQQHPFAGCRPQTFLLVAKDFIARCFLGKEDEDAMIEEGKEFFDKKKLEEFFTYTGKLRKKYFDFAEQFQTQDFSKLSNAALASLFEEYSLVVAAGLALYHQSQHEPMVAAEERIVEILESHYPNAREIMLRLIEPYELDWINKDEVYWLTLLTEKDELTRQEWEKYIRQCSWNTWNTYDDDALYRTYVKRFKQEKGDHRARIAEMKERKVKHRVEVEEILDKVQSDELRYLVEVLHRTTLGRMWIKPMWAGAEFLARRLFAEIAKRLECSVKDVSDRYRIQEVIAALKGGPRISDEEAERRKQAYFIGYSDGKEFFLSGDDALKFAAENFPDTDTPESTDELKGTPASLGKAQGRVRILLSENIARVKQVDKEFKKGDILVADMTQPAAVVLMSKAGAIVTDEGGLTSHAAVVSREFGIPCVVGTQKATEIFKDGDMIEVDAEKGIVKRL